jgi:hypothetical protein
VANIQAGDLVFARGVSEIEIDCSATGMVPLAGIASVAWASGLAITAGATVGNVSAKAFALGSMSMAAGYPVSSHVRAAMTVAAPPDGSGDYVGCGCVAVADATKTLSGGVGHNGTSAREAGALNGTISYSAAVLSFVTTASGIVQRYKNAAGTTSCHPHNMCINNSTSVNLSLTDAHHTGDCVFFEIKGSAQAALYTAISRA